jgi:hypothetical protein
VRYGVLARQQLVRGTAISACFLIALAYVAHRIFGGASFATLLGVQLAVLAISTYRTRSLHARGLATFELLVGPRTLHRAVAGAPAAEVLRPEVMRAYDTPLGLWLTCEKPRRSLHIVRAVEGFDALRTRLATWCGFAAWRRAMSEIGHLGPRDEVGGTALESDPSLALELEELRRAASTVGTAYP